MGYALFIAFFILHFLATACSSDTYESPVPAPGRVYYTCNIITINASAQQTAGQAQLDSPGGYVCIADPHLLGMSALPGQAGLLLLQSSIDVGQFYAFDLACPYCYRQGGHTPQRIGMKDDGLTATCPTCQSEYGAVMWGSPAPTAGPANEAGYILRQYRATLMADGYTLVVTR